MSTSERYAAARQRIRQRLASTQATADKAAHYIDRLHKLTEHWPIDRTELEDIALPMLAEAAEDSAEAGRHVRRQRESLHITLDHMQARWQETLEKHPDLIALRQQNNRLRRQIALLEARTKAHNVGRGIRRRFRRSSDTES